MSNVYVYNAGNAPAHYGSSLIIPARGYAVVSSEDAEQLRDGLPIQVEGDPDFVPLWKQCKEKMS